MFTQGQSKPIQSNAKWLIVRGGFELGLLASENANGKWVHDAKKNRQSANPLKSMDLPSIGSALVKC